MGKGNTVGRTSGCECEQDWDANGDVVGDLDRIRMAGRTAFYKRDGNRKDGNHTSERNPRRSESQRQWRRRKTGRKRREEVMYLGVIMWALVLVTHKQTDWSAKCYAVLGARLELHEIFFVPLYHLLVNNNAEHLQRWRTGVVSALCPGRRLLSCVCTSWGVSGRPYMLQNQYICAFVSDSIVCIGIFGKERVKCGCMRGNCVRRKEERILTGGQPSIMAPTEAQ